jgi:hypothetical protein
MQGFSTEVPRNPRVLRDVARGSSRVKRLRKAGLMALLGDTAESALLGLLE